MSTTTTAAIIAWAAAKVQTLTPSSRSSSLYVLAPRRTDFAAWLAASSGSPCFRRFAIVRSSDRRDADVLNPVACEVSRDLSLQIAYPDLPADAGPDEEYDVVDIAEEDARQLRDVLMSPSNHTVDGHLATMATVRGLSREGAVWLMTIDLSVVYYEAQTYS